MLSFIHSITEEFEQKNGAKPNLIYLSHNHFEDICRELPDLTDLATEGQLLGMEIVLTHDAALPSVTWVNMPVKPAMRV